METAKRKKRYEKQRFFSSKRKSSQLKRSHREQRSNKFEKYREEETSMKRKYKGEYNEDHKSKRSKSYEAKIRVVEKQRSSSESSYSPKERTDIYYGRNMDGKQNEQWISKDKANINYKSRQPSKNRDYSFKSNYKTSKSRQESELIRRNKGKEKSESKKAVQRQINDMLSTERHHTKYVDRSTSGNSTSGNFTSGKIKYVEWCPRYIDPDIKGHVRGGISLLHHRCRQCRRLCFHLLGQPGTIRLCLGCSGYKEKYIPDWYYHQRCKHC